MATNERAVIHLVAVEDLSGGETARMLGVSVGTAMLRLSRARAPLRRGLDAPPAPLLRVVR